MRCWVVFGTWKLRHNEPMSPGEAVLRLIPLRLAPDLSRSTVNVKICAETFASDGRRIDGDDRSDPWSGLLPSLEEEIPLALAVEEDGRLVIRHALMRIVEPIAQFFRVEDPGGSAGLAERIAAVNQAGHLILSNHECFYVKDEQDIELEQKLTLGKPYQYLELCLRLCRALAAGEAPGFQPQLGDELQHWSYDNWFYEIRPNEKREGGYLSVISYCKKKRSWDDPMFMFKKKIYDVDSLERWERNFENQRVEGDKKEALERYFGYPIAPLPTWRRTRADVAFESDAGNIFMVNFDDCRVDAGAPECRLQQGEIEYLKTRGKPDRAQIYADFERLVAFTESKLRDWGYSPSRTHYSKLTFLKEYVEARR